MKRLKNGYFLLVHKGLSVFFENFFSVSDIQKKLAGLIYLDLINL